MDSKVVALMIIKYNLTISKDSFSKTGLR